MGFEISTAELRDISPRLDILDNSSDVINNVEASVLSTGKTVSAALAIVGEAIAHGRSQDESDCGGPSLADRRLVEDWIPEFKSIIEGAERVEDDTTNPASIRDQSSGARPTEP